MTKYTFLHTSGRLIQPASYRCQIYPAITIKSYTTIHHSKLHKLS